MNRFIRDNVLITIVLLISISIIISYIFTLDVPELFEHAGDWFNVIFQFSIGFIINFVFYVTQVYIPRKRQLDEAYSCIYKRICTIEHYMNEMFFQLSKVYIVKFDCQQDITEQQMKVILKKIDFDDTVNVVNIERLDMENECFSVKEWIGSRIEFVEYEIDKLYLYYSSYISPDLMNVLEQILKSNMHKNIGKMYLKSPEKIKFDQCEIDIFFWPYYCLMKELREVGKQYK